MFSICPLHKSINPYSVYLKPTGGDTLSAKVSPKNGLPVLLSHSRTALVLDGSRILAGTGPPD